MSKFISKKETIKDSIPLISLFVAINLVLMILITYIPILSIVIIFILPIPSILICLFIKNKYYYIYFLSSILLSLLVSIGDISYCITTLLPVLIISPLIGFLINKKFSLYLIILICSFLMYLINYCLIYFINYLFNIDIIKNILVLLKINNCYIYLFLPSIIYLIALAEIFIMVFISFKEIIKLKKLELNNKFNDLISIFLNLLFTSLTIITYFFDEKFYILFLIISILSILNIFKFKEKCLQNSIIFLVLLAITWILYIFIYKYFTIINSFIVLLFLVISIVFYKIIFLSYLKIKTKK